ncbi:uncharacterized protein LOC133836547 isoform X2 [Drosophila sulfurigaster albostrigata]|uniref:uncharacterized protein LOC133836547 isoform X2 n=1 Tax=Drosophila sulfurigaster albostrigata TaxID=89887 RepID=UPI002D21CF00|nr:uncharacterized protein LOC133836547 isoform X2 [Drosophila sulfurigaster albostrigata]
MTSKQLLIFILLLIPWPPSNVIKILCSRDNSRLVRKIVRSKWTPILDKHQVKLPLECPLHPLRDVFAPRQDEKQRDRPTQWTCRRCGKSFYQEKYLDLHFDTRHKSIINEAEDSVCLADFCDIMRCEVFQTEDASSLKFGDQHIVTDIEVWGDSLGQNSALAKANAAYLSLIPRTSTLSATRAAKVQNRQLLQEKPSQSREQSQQSEAAATAATAAGEEPKSAAEKLLMKLKELGQAHLKRTEPESKSKAEPKQNETDEEGEEHSGDAEGSGQPNAATKTPHGEGAEAANGQAKVRANCKPEELSKLKSRCELLLRGCIGGLLLSMSDQSFKEMEEEMNKAVCWYLTCDRYWEDGPLEPRAFPWGLIVILIFVLSTGICFCYYIIWILFDHLFQLRRNDNQCQQPLCRRRSRRQHLHACPPSSLPCRLCDTSSARVAAAASAAGRRRDTWSDCRGPAAAATTAVLPATTAAGGGGSGISARFVPRTSAISSTQSATLHRRSASSGGSVAGQPGYAHLVGRRPASGSVLLQRQHAIASSSLDEPGLPTGHFRPTRLYK